MKKFIDKIIQQQIGVLDKHVHNTFFTPINFFVFALMFREPLTAYLICLGIAVLWEVLQKIMGGKNTIVEMIADAFASNFSAIFLFGLISIIIK